MCCVPISEREISFRIKKNIINPSMLLEGQKLASTFEELNENYRYTFIDAPPLNLVSDGEKDRLAV